jgi:hypothetical protein
MNFLLVVFAFTMSPDGGIQDATVMKQAFVTEEGCNKAGRELRDFLNLPPEVKTLSYCVDKRDFAPKA